MYKKANGFKDAFDDLKSEWEKLTGEVGEKDDGSSESHLG